MTTEQILNAMNLCKGEPIAKIMQLFSMGMWRDSDLADMAQFFGCPCEREAVARCLSLCETMTEAVDEEEDLPAETEPQKAENAPVETPQEPNGIPARPEGETPAEAKEEADDDEEKEEPLTQPERRILEEMERRAEGGDDALAAALRDEGKSIKECYRYVEFKARQEIEGGYGGVMIDDAVVYGWAVHYYTEPKEVVEEEMRPKVQTNPAPADKSCATAPKPKGKAAKKTTPKKGKDKDKPKKNVSSIERAITSKKKDDGGGKPKRTPKKDNLEAGFVPMERPETEKEAKKGSREQAKSVEQMDLFADFFAE